MKTPRYIIDQYKLTPASSPQSMYMDLFKTRSLPEILASSDNQEILIDRICESIEKHFL